MIGYGHSSLPTARVLVKTIRKARLLNKSGPPEESTKSDTVPSVPPWGRHAPAGKAPYEPWDLDLDRRVGSHRLLRRPGGPSRTRDTPAEKREDFTAIRDNLQHQIDGLKADAAGRQDRISGQATTISRLVTDRHSLVGHIRRAGPEPPAPRPIPVRARPFLDHTTCKNWSTSA
ncbi:hypothetical protein ABZ946_12215 [Streptomyces sp. NPDC046324]|uniref:hypothetical protein n=1 Tax=Streptomyces sp. NPDC046324 TaxID=3154915 RepID=UPI0033DB3F17